MRLFGRLHVLGPDIDALNRMLEAVLIGTEVGALLREFLEGRVEGSDGPVRPVGERRGT